MKSTLRFGLALSLAAFGLPALAGTIASGFSGATAPGNFSTTNTGTLGGSSPAPGTAAFTSTQLTLTGSNAVSPGGSGSTDPACVGSQYGLLGPCSTRTVISLGGVVSFDWSYASADLDGPAGDIFGVLVDNVAFVLSNPGGAVNQTGSRSFTAQQSFGWFMNCTDCINGSARAVVSNLSVVSEPATLALVGLSLLGAIGASRRARQLG